MKNNTPDISLIRKYLKGELDVKAMYQLERQAQDDPMLMDIILGMEGADSNADEDNLSAISERIRKRVAEHKVRKMIPWRTWTVAASLIVAFMAALWWFNQPLQTEIVQQSAQLKTIEKDTVRIGKQRAEPIVAVPAVKQPLKKTPLFRKNQLAGLSRKPVPAADKIPAEAVIDPLSAEQYLMRRRADSTAIAKNSGVYGNAKMRIDSTVSLKELAIAGAVQSKQSATAAVSVISGNVYDQQDGTGIPGVAVMIKGTKTGQVTDSRGHYSIPVTDENVSLVFNYVGYNRKEVKTGKSNQLDVTMAPSADQLSEVVVVGYGTQKKTAIAGSVATVRDNPVPNQATATNRALSGRVAGVQIDKNKVSNSTQKSKKAIPLNGWEAYRKYLEESTVVTGRTGEVIVKFNIDTLGRPVNPVITKGLNEDLDKKAILIILNGSGWTRGEKGIAEEIKLKLRFH